MESIIALNYTNPYHPTAYGSISTVYKYYKKDVDIGIVEDVLSRIPAFTEKRHVRKVKTHVPVYVFFKRELFQMDLVDIAYISKSNYGVKYLFTIIDSTTRFAYVIPLKNKSGALVAAKFEDFLSRLQEKPRRVHSDAGGEFKSFHMKNVLSKYGIKQSFPRRKYGHAPTIERFNQTIQGLIYKHLKAFNTNRYIDQLDKIVSIYNNRVHSSISPLSPSEAENEKNRSFLIRRLMKNYSKAFLKGKNMRENDLKEGIRVLISSPKKQFHKGYKDQYSKKAYHIKSIDKSKNVPLFILGEEDGSEMLQGGFYREEIQKVGTKEDLPPLPKYKITKTRGGEAKKDVFISWKDFPEKYSMWIPKKILKNYNNV